MRGPAATQATVFPSPQKPTFPNSNSIWNQVDEEPLCGCATSKSVFYLFSRLYYSLLTKAPILGLNSGLLIFRGKKSKISRDFQGQIRGKIGRFHGIFVGKKSKFVENWLILRDFCGRKVKNSQKSRPISRDFSRKKSNFKGFSGANS